MRGPRLRGALGAAGDCAGRRDNRMITSLAARRGSLTPRTGKEAGAEGRGSQRVGSWSSPSAQHTFGRLGLAAGEGGEAQGAKGLSCDLWVGCGGGGPFILEFCTIALGSGNHCRACRSWKRPDASRCVASSAHAPAFLSPLSVLGAVLCTLPCNCSHPGRWVRLSSFNRGKQAQRKEVTCPRSHNSGMWGMFLGSDARPGVGVFSGQ